VTFLSFVLAFMGFALLVILHELGHFTAAKAVGMRVEKFSLFFPPKLLSRKIGETEYQIGAIPAGGYVKISGMNPDEELPEEVRDRAYHAQPVWKRIVVIGAGPAVNLVLAFILLFIFFAAIGPETGSSKVGSTQKGYPAAGVLHPGDRIVAVDGVRAAPQRLGHLITRRHGCSGPRSQWESGCLAKTPAQITVVRNGRQRTFSLRPKWDPTAFNPVTKSDSGLMRVGVSYQGGPRDRYSVGDSLHYSVLNFWDFTKATAELPARLINPEQRKQLSGIVGSYEVTRQTILVDVEQVVMILAVISLSLAIVNLFPFLPLDGGHIFWAIVEKVRGKPVSLAVMEKAGVVGFMLVILIFLIGLSNDIGRLSGEGFQVR
jgi:regulator of sigma E protease